jgi:hypothetical protein
MTGVVVVAVAAEYENAVMIALFSLDGLRLGEMRQISNDVPSKFIPNEA